MSVKYRYRSVSPTTIRLVTLEPASNDDALRCQIRHVELASTRAGGPGGGQKVEYEALSYEWGVLGATEDLVCDSGVLKITPSLDSALKHLRWGHKGRTLWVDQICINQEDVAERSQQVCLMGDIYRNAKQVVSWLGEDADGHGVVARSFITGLSEGKFPPLGKQIPYDITLLANNWPVRDSPQWEALRAILSLGYWTRLWILQEVELAHRVTLQWGRTEMRFDVLHSCCLFLFGQNSGLWEILNWKLFNVLDLGAIIAHNPGPTSGASFEGRMTLGSNFKSTQAQDRIYAILSLVNDGPAIQPDYAKSVPEVFMEATCKTIALRKDLGIFN
ncbi:Heterokaryon incompatibility protein (HET) domain containing protein [Rhypophila sp. PSN 637]